MFYYNNHFVQLLWKQKENVIRSNYLSGILDSPSMEMLWTIWHIDRIKFFSPKKKKKLKKQTKKKWNTLTRRLSWLKHHSVHQKAVGSISSQGIYLGWGFDPQLGCKQESNGLMFLPSSVFSHSLILPCALSKINKYSLRWGLKEKIAITLLLKYPNFCESTLKKLRIVSWRPVDFTPRYRANRNGCTWALKTCSYIKNMFLMLLRTYRDVLRSIICKYESIKLHSNIHQQYNK